MAARASRMFACLLAWALATSPAQAFDLRVPADKAAHFGVSYAIADQLIRLGLTPDEAVAATLAVGWFKEVTDSRPDPLDMTANIAGALLAAYVRVELRF